MTFISYAQNFEDVMLWRALKDIEKGFYIDIGAQDPMVDSVSMAFYEHGWRGVSVEPTTQYANLLRQNRPDEIIEQVAIGQETGTLDFYEFPDTGLSTADNEIAQQHKLAGFACNLTQIPVLTLDELFDRYAASKEVHWLKVDVEGHEKQVLASWRKSQVRPWILIIESTLPLSQKPNYQEWEQLLLDKNYLFAYADGLNRFYVAQEHSALLSQFLYPPNVFDDFLLKGTASHSFHQLLTSSIEQAENRISQSELKVQQSEQQAQQAEQRAQQAEQQAQQSEQQAQQAEQRAQQAEQQAQQAEQRTQQAEQKAQQAEQRAQQAEQKAQQAEQRAQQAEQRAQQAEQRAQQAEQKAQQSEQKAQQTTHEAESYRQQFANAQAYITALHASKSWRITRPLRGVRRILRGDLGPIVTVKNGFKRRIKNRLIALIGFVRRHSYLNKPALWCLKHIPSLKVKLLMLARGNEEISFINRIDPVTSAEGLSPQASRIYRDLKSAIEYHEKRSD